jgi:TolB protein
MAWSPDDRQIAATRVDSSRAMQVWVMSADGSNSRALTHFASADGSPQWPAWSPDGKQIAVQANVSNRGRGHSFLWTIDVTTGKATRISRHSEVYQDETPSWFPDGRRLAFQSDRTDTMQVWIMNADGSDPKQLTR